MCLHVLRYLCLALLMILAGCASVQYTVDDGRPLDSRLLASIRAYGQAEKALRPAVVRSAALKDAECDKQWELPFAVVSSQAWPEGNSRVAWARALNVDERLTMVAVHEVSGLKVGDKIQEIDGQGSTDARAMLARLSAARDDGSPFKLRLSDGRQISIVPLQVCRGHVLVAPPGKPAAQDYHWEMSVHPLAVFASTLTPDEALWVVLWTQGISEEAGARMKAYHVGKVTLRLISLASLVTGVGAVAQAGQTAASSAAANAAMSNAAGQLVARQMASSVGQSLADTVLNYSTKEALQRERDAERLSAANRSALSGIAWAAGTAFDKADAWAFKRMAQMGADPLAAISLHRKLALQGEALNAFVFDGERLQAIKAQAHSAGKAGQLAAILEGQEAGEDAIASLSVDAMPSASLERPEQPVPLMMASFPPESHGGLLESLSLASEQ